MADAAASSHVRVEVADGAPYAVLTIAKEPVNSMDLALWSALEAALAQCENTPSLKGLIITSGLTRDVFTAGNDLRELYAPLTSLERYRQFWVTQNRFLVSLYRSRLVTLSAIRGACPAGGCAISLACDHRIMTPQGHIGLNEVLLGIPVPKYWGMLMQGVMGKGPAEQALLAGSLLSPQQALRLGLVHSLAEDSSALGLLAAAEAVMKRLVRLPDTAYAATKANLRADFCAAWEAYYPAEVDGAWQFLNAPETLKTLGGAMKRLSSKDKGPAKSKL